MRKAYAGQDEASSMRDQLTTNDQGRFDQDRFGLFRLTSILPPGRGNLRVTSNSVPAMQSVVLDRLPLPRRLWA